MEVKSGETPSILFFMGTTSDATIGLANVAGTIAIEIGLAGVAMAAGAGVVAEEGGANNGDGWYNYTPAAGETTSGTDTQLKFKATVAGAKQHNSMHDVVLVSRAEFIAKVDAVKAVVDAIAPAGSATLSAAERNAIADHVLRRSASAVKSSTDGDALTGNAYSIYGLIMGLLNGDSSSGLEWVIRHTDNSQLASLPIDLFDSNKLISKVGA